MSSVLICRFAESSLANVITSNARDAICKGVEAATTSVQFNNSKKEQWKHLRFQEIRSESELMRRVRNAGVGRRLLGKQRSCRWTVQAVIPVNFAPTRGE